MILEELAIVLTEIQARVNFRSLPYLRSSANEASPISPAHFLIGRMLTVLPEANLSYKFPSCKTNKRRPYKQVSSATNSSPLETLKVGVRGAAAVSALLPQIGNI